MQPGDICGFPTQHRRKRVLLSCRTCRREMPVTVPYKVTLKVKEVSTAKIHGRRGVYLCVLFNDGKCRQPVGPVLAGHASPIRPDSVVRRRYALIFSPSRRVCTCQTFYIRLGKSGKARLPVAREKKRTIVTCPWMLVGRSLRKESLPEHDVIPKP